MQRVGWACTCGRMPPGAIIAMVRVNWTARPRSPPGLDKMRGRLPDESSRWS